MLKVGKPLRITYQKRLANGATITQSVELEAGDEFLAEY